MHKLDPIGRFTGSSSRELRSSNRRSFNQGKGIYSFSGSVLRVRGRFEEILMVAGRSLRLGLAQIDAVVGDLRGNLGRISDSFELANKNGVDIVAFPELSTTGYPPEDLVLKKEFIDDNLRAFDAFVSSTNGKGPIAIVGFVDRDESGNIFNAAGIVWNGKVFGTYHKILLPNYGVFDE